MSQLDEIDQNLKEAYSLIGRLKSTIKVLKTDPGYTSIMGLIQQQQRTIDELREEVQRLWDANNELRRERDEFESKWRWHFYDEELEPEHIREFLTDIGIEPAMISKMSLGDRMALRDAIIQNV